MIIVDKKFNCLASDPVLWKKYPIPAMQIAFQYGLDILLEVLKLPKFSKLEILDLSRILPSELKDNLITSDQKDLEQKFLRILEMASTLPLKSLDLSYNDLNLSYNSMYKPMDQEFLSKMVLNIQHVQFNATFCQFGGQLLLGKILDKVSERSVLRSIDLRSCRLKPLSIARIVKLNCLTEVSMESALMTKEQARALMVEMGKGSIIKKFGIGSKSVFDVINNVLENVEPEIF